MLYVSKFESALNFSRNVKVSFKNRGETLEAVGEVGQSLYDVVVNADLSIDGYGACEGALACCTCHVILEPDHYKRLHSFIFLVSLEGF